MAFDTVLRGAIPVLFALFGFFTPFSIAGAHISLGLASLALFLHPESRRRAGALARRHPLVLPILAWCLVHFLSVIFAYHPEQSFEKLKKLLLLILLPIGALPQTRRHLRSILAVLIASTVIVAGWGLVSHLSAGGGIDARIRGISGFYMTVAGILMIVALLCLSELLSALKDPRGRRITFLSVAGASTVAALLGTYTRGSWIGFFVGALVLLRRRLIAVGALAVVAVLFFVIGPNEARDRVLSIVDPSHERNVERVLIWTHGLELAKRDPWTGLGLVLPAELMEREVLTEHGIIRVHSHMHNAFLQIVVSMGFPALLVFFWFLWELFQMGRRAAQGRILNLWEDGLVAAYPAILAALLMNGMFEWNFGDSEVLGLFYFVTGCVLGIESGTDV